MLFYCVLLLISTIELVPVECKVDLNCEADQFIMEENKPSRFNCTAKDQIPLSGNFSWNIDINIPGHDRLFIINDENNTIVTTFSQDKKVVKSTLTVHKPPTKYDSLIYYYGRYTPAVGQYDEQNNPVQVFKEESLPVPKVSNTTHFLPVSEITMKVGDKVTLKCQVKYDNKNLNTGGQYKYEVRWVNNNNKVIVKKLFEYKSDKNTERLDTDSVHIKRSEDGGDYVCVTNLTKTKSKVELLSRHATITIKIEPYVNGPMEKEVKEVAGDDALLKCDIVGYPITYEWLDENRKKIDLSKDSRITIDKNKLKIDDIDYEHRKKFICVGKVGANELEQVIILRVKDRLAPLWPFIGIMIEAVLIFVIIYGVHYYKSKKTTSSDGPTSPVIVDATASSTNI